MDNWKTTLFEQAPIPSAVVKLAALIVLGPLVTVLYNLVDTYFMGVLNNPIQNATVTLAAPVLLAFNVVNNLFGMGSSSMMNRVLGRKKYETVRRSSAFGFYCMLFNGTLLPLIYMVFHQPLLEILEADVNTIEVTEGYLIWAVTFGAVPAVLNVTLAYMARSEGASLYTSIDTTGGCLLNIIIDPIFIMPQGLNMRAVGAGLVMFLPSCVACIYSFVLLYRKRGNIYTSIRPREFGFRKLIVLRVCEVGILASIQDPLNMTGTTILNNLTSTYGANAVAATGATQKISTMSLQIAMGFSRGIMPLIGYTYASGSHKQIKEAISFTMKMLFPFLMCVSLTYCTFAGGLTKSFTDSPTIITYETRFLQGFCLNLPFMCMDLITVGIFQAIGMGRSAPVFTTLRKIMLEIPALYIPNYLFPFYGLTYAQFTTELVLSIAVIAILRGVFVKLQKTEYL